MCNEKKVNFICRVITDKDGKFKFDVMYRSDITITNGKSYETFEEVNKELCAYLNKLCKYDLQPNCNSRLVVTDAIFEK